VGGVGVGGGGVLLQKVKKQGTAGGVFADTFGGVKGLQDGGRIC